MINEKILLQLLDIFRDEIAVTAGSNAVAVALHFLAWNKASALNLCPEQLKMSSCQGVGPSQLPAIFQELSHHLNDPAFSGKDIDNMSHLSAPAISSAISCCLNMAQTGVLDGFDPTDAVLVVDDRRGDSFALPPEVADLLVALAGELQGQNVYLPWEATGQLVGRALKSDAKVFVETVASLAFPTLIASLLDGRETTTVVRNDPLKTPAFVKSGRLSKFEKAITFPPFNVKLNADSMGRDLYDRFPEKTRSMTVLAVRHLMAQTQGRIVLAVPNSLLFSAGAERSLRESLLQQQMIEAVIALPQGLLGSTSIAFNILVLNTEQKSAHVRFVSADNPRFKVTMSRTKAQLINVQELADLAFNGEDSTIVKSISTFDILKNDAQLQVSRYMLGENEQSMERLLQSMKSRKLDEVATLVKPMVNIGGNNGIAVLEVGAADLPDYGFIRSPKKQTFVEYKADKITDQFLRPNDIVIIVKGNIGKVGIVPSDVPPPGPLGWIGGQSAAVIRLKNWDVVDPRALLVLLRSDLGKALIKGMSAGTAVPFVQLRELKHLEIPIPTDSESKKAIDALIEEDALQAQILELQQRQALLAASCWALQANEAETQ